MTDLLAAAVSDDRLKTLRTLRDRLAGDIDECRSARDVASLSQRLMDVLDQIDKLERASANQQKGTPLDELEKRRADRRAAANIRAGAEGEVV